MTLIADVQDCAPEPLTIKVFGSLGALSLALKKKEVRIYSCLNGFTIRALLNEGVYDQLLARGGIAFVVDGVSARYHLGARGFETQRICGRDLMAEALREIQGPLAVIGGTESNQDVVTSALEQHLGRSSHLITPPIFKDSTELAAFAIEAARSIPDNALVLVFIRSPLQDLLSGELAARTQGTVFINVGAVIDDIVRDQLGMVRVFSAVRLEWLYRLVTNPRRTGPKIVGMLKAPVGAARDGYRWQEL